MCACECVSESVSMGWKHLDKHLVLYLKRPCLFPLLSLILTQLLSKQILVVYKWFRPQEGVDKQRSPPGHHGVLCHLWNTVTRKNRTYNFVLRDESHRYTDMTACADSFIPPRLGWEGREDKEPVRGAGTSHRFDGSGRLLRPPAELHVRT